jgi:hypothetical protein
MTGIHSAIPTDYGMGIGFHFSGMSALIVFPEIIPIGIEIPELSSTLSGSGIY